MGDIHVERMINVDRINESGKSDNWVENWLRGNRVLSERGYFSTHVIRIKRLKDGQFLVELADDAFICPT
jgi:hypothetical protein